jgi:hypothetical protein
MESPIEPAARPDEPALRGPYDAEQYGRAADGEPVNGFGRTQAMNEAGLDYLPSVDGVRLWNRVDFQ